jgi:signal peptidase
MEAASHPGGPGRGPLAWHQNIYWLAAKKTLAFAATVMVVFIALVMFLPGLLGYERYVITGGSMEGTFERGSVIFAEPVPVEELEIGDVITYDPPPEAHTDGLVTHRIYRIDADAKGERVFQTKGDANLTPDPWRFTLDKGTQARVQYLHLPLVGYLPAALGKRDLRILFIGLPALLLAVGVVARMWREAGAEAAAEAAAGSGARR